MNQTQLFEVTVKEGDCLLVPAWWWMQSYTVSTDEHPNTLIIDFDFETHSELYALINEGIESNFILGDENEAERIHQKMHEERRQKEEMERIN